MKHKTFSLCLALTAVVGVGCTQNQNVADASKKRAYRSTNYTQTGSHIPGSYQQYPGGDDLSQSEQQRDQFQRIQTNGGTFGAPREGSGGGGLGRQ